MDNKIKSAFLGFKNMKNKQKVLIVICLLGVALILLSELTPSQHTEKKNDSTDYQQYATSLEKKTEDIISSINGVGKCKVMITLAQTNESFYAQNYDESTNNSSISKKNEYVFYEDNSNDSPVLIKQAFPKVLGVAVVCQGGGNSAVKENVISAISSLFGISSAKISVSKLNR